MTAEAARKMSVADAVEKRCQTRQSSDAEGSSLANASVLRVTVAVDGPARGLYRGLVPPTEAALR